ncbi:hypothetical protein XENTR_v10017141 [Xenopus tropicalis]|nr:hypothetical protein XENTR_v10017141 [Xenopus tropicalis]
MASVVRRIISTAKAPAAIGPYSQAVVVDKTMYVSGQLGMDPSSGQLVAGGVKNEAKQALVNMGEILKAAGCDYSNVVKTTVLLADIGDFNDVNEVYKQFFRCNFPARAAYQVAALPRVRTFFLHLYELMDFQHRKLHSFSDFFLFFFPLGGCEGVVLVNCEYISHICD